MSNSETKVRPGINSAADTSVLSNDEKQIVNKFAAEWYVTNIGVEKISAKSQQKYFIMKPTENYKELLNIELEIVAILSSYLDFEPRTLDAVDAVYRKFPSLRIDKLCCVIISKDSEIIERISDLIKRDQESRIIVPFSYEEILQNYNDNFYLRNRFKIHFYSRDLFAFESPLKKDLYFFGRNDLVLKLADRIQSNENAALFGLRKTGKTSVIFGVKRYLEAKGERVVFVDCQSPSLHRRRWNAALWYIVNEIRLQICDKLNIPDEDEFTEINASLLFEKAMKEAHFIIGERSILLIFDEIENITFRTSPSEHWTNQLDFVFLWQSIRTVFQKNNRLFSFIITGTNPNAIETPQVNRVDNPIFNQLYFEYIPSFDVPQTREMVRKLGRIMGLHFDEVIYGRLTEDFGGHPFLIRHICSTIHSLSGDLRPVRVDITLYEKSKQEFQKNYRSFVEMILGVLENYYPLEFDMLTYLALGNVATFNELAEYSSELTNHLIGYKILDKNQGRYSIKINAIRDYILEKQRYKKVLNSSEERIAEISERRNKLEVKIRSIIRMQMLSRYGKSDATIKYLDVIGEPRKTNYAGRSFTELFDPSISIIYFEDIRKVIIKYFEIFDNIFGKNKRSFEDHMEVINKYRADAHAKDVSKEEMDLFRYHINKIEEQVETFLHDN